MVDEVFFPNPVQVPASRPVNRPGTGTAVGSDTPFARVLD